MADSIPTAQLVTRPWLRWGVGGLLLVGFHLLLALISPSFAYGREALEKPILLLVGIELSAGVLYLLVIRGIRDTPHSRALLIWIIAVGAVLRISLLPSTPMLEDDYYRYLWDGAVVAAGINPYAYAPSEVVEEGNDSGTFPSVLNQLAAESGAVASRVNHPELRSIYPPTAQATFALAHWFRPWSITAWRLTLLVFDVAALAILIAILRELDLPLLSLAIYWWNPLLIKEIFNSSHMDVIVLPFVLGSVLLTIRRKNPAAAGTLALATGAKLWPIALLPVVLRPALSRPGRLISSLCVFGLLSCALLYPIFAAGLDSDSGFMAYGKRWEMNDALFMLLLWGAQFSLKAIEVNSGVAQLVTRTFVLLILIMWIAWLVRRNASDPADLCEKCLLIIAAVFLLSPTQFPWYFVWMLPFLAIRPRTSLLLLTALLPLYYLRFYFGARRNVEIFDYGVVWLEYIPVWCLLIREWYLNRYHRSTPRSEAAV